MNAPRVAIVILAAGTSSRLGTPKQLLELGGEPLIRHTVRNAEASSACVIVLVVGSRAEEVAAAAGDGEHRVIVNSAFAAGQSTSMIAGLQALGDDIDAVIMMLGDQPTVQPGLIDRLIERFNATGAPIVRPSYNDGPGNPVLFAKDLFPDLNRVTGDLGARDLIRARKDVVDVLVIDQPMPPDVDSEADYAELKRRWERARTP